MRRVAVLAALLVLQFAPSWARAGTVLVREDGSAVRGPWQTWVDHDPMPTPDARLTVSFTNPLNLSAIAYFVPEQAATMYVPKPWYLRRSVLLHELGHLYDYTYLDDADRRSIMSRILHRSGAWRQPGGDSPHEQFAAAYELAATHSPLVDGAHDGDYGLRLGPKRLTLLRTWLRNIPRLR